MAKSILLFLCTVLVHLSFSQNLIGAWEWTEAGEEGMKVRGVVTFSEGYQAAAWFDAETGDFIRTNGGTWNLEGTTMTEVAEFNSEDPEKVGLTKSFEIEWDGADKMRIVGMETWATRVDSGEPGALAGAWLISGRMRNGDLQSINTLRSRKTMKILSGTRFQWIAYDTATKEFKGTGGGSYTTIDGKYTENIEFFSRDNSRVGASLEFSYELKDGDWQHSGKNSRGEPMFEVWSVRE
ncbi:membrane or secreted protein [Ekhidna sp. To15]|uniref:membrane or secreted protein n=1 Tax=Ekhidna sp. To15 TaxID=3395267 RepID=UPI003F526BA5